MKTISVIEETKNYVILKVPRSIIRRGEFDAEKVSEKAALDILRRGMNEYRTRKTKVLGSLRDLRSAI